MDRILERWKKETKWVFKMKNKIEIQFSLFEIIFAWATIHLPHSAGF